MKSTYQIICDKVDVQLEINTAVASKRMEQNAMLVMPVVFIFLLKMMGSDMIDLRSVQGCSPPRRAWPVSLWPTWWVRRS